MKQAVILAGGAGLKLRPLTFLSPKPLLPLVNKPLLDYLVFILKAAGITKVIMTTDYLSEILETYVSEHPQGLEWTFRRVNQYKGSAQLLCSFSEILEDTFMVLPGDCLFDADLTRYLDEFKASDAAMGVLVRKEADLLGKGFLQTYQGYVLGTTQKLVPGALSDAWIYVMKKRVLALVKSDYMDIHMDLLKAVISSGQAVKAFEMTGFWAVIGRIHPYMATNFWILQNMDNPAHRGSSVALDSSVSLTPPYFLDEGCVIGPGSELGPNVILGKNVTIGARSKLDNAMIDTGCTIGEACKISHSVVSHDVVLEDSVLIGQMSLIAPYCKIKKGAVLKDGARVGPHLTILERQLVSDILFPPDFATPAFRLHPTMPLSADESLICAKLQQGGEQPLSGLQTLTQLSEDALKTALITLAEKKMILSYGDTPVIYTLT